MCVLCRARLDTISKAKYGTLLQELGGWGWLQELLPVSGGWGRRGGGEGPRGGQGREGQGKGYLGEKGPLVVEGERGKGGEGDGRGGGVIPVRKV